MSLPQFTLLLKAKVAARLVYILTMSILRLLVCTRSRIKRPAVSGPALYHREL